MTCPKLPSRSCFIVISAIGRFKYSGNHPGFKVLLLLAQSQIATEVPDLRTISNHCTLILVSSLFYGLINIIEMFLLSHVYLNFDVEVNLKAFCKVICLKRSIDDYIKPFTIVSTKQHNANIWPI